MNKIKNYLQNDSTISTATVIAVTLFVILLFVPFTSGLIGGLIILFSLLGGIGGVVWFFIKKDQEKKAIFEPFAWLVSLSTLISLILVPMWIVVGVLKIVLGAPGIFIFLGILIVIAYFLMKKYGIDKELR